MKSYTIGCPVSLNHYLNFSSMPSFMILSFLMYMNVRNIPGSYEVQYYHFHLTMQHSKWMLVMLRTCPCTYEYLYLIGKMWKKYGLSLTKKFQ